MSRPLCVTGAAFWPPAGATPGQASPEPEVPDGVDPRTVRRSTRLGRLALGVASEALVQARLTPPPEGTGLVVGTALADLDETAGFLGGIHVRGARFASPQFFQRSVHGAVAGELAILFGLRGFNLTVSEGLSSGEAALEAGALAVRAGRAERCLIVAVDGRSQALTDALAALGIEGGQGEGAAAVVLETEEGARSRGAEVLLRLEGVDARRRPAPTVHTHGASSLCQLARYASGVPGAAPPASVSVGSESPK